MLSRLISNKTCAISARYFATLNEIAAKNRPSPSELYEPTLVPKQIYPEYPLLNFRLRCYDFVILEKYQSLLHRIAIKFDLQLNESYASAAQTCRAVLYKPGTTIIASECQLAAYERTIQLISVPAPTLSLFVNILTAHLPSGLELTVKVNEKADQTARYIPDHQLKAKQAELLALDDPIVRKNLGWSD